jgi:uncharacterized protein (DUF2147 family)
MSRVAVWACVGLAWCVAHPAARADDADDAVLGQWVEQKGEARFEFTKVDGKYYGKIVWLKEPTYPKDDEEAGKPVHDRYNPDPSKRDKPLVGLELFKAFEYTADNTWANGSIYNPNNGKTYQGMMWMTGKDELNMRGFIGIPLLGGTRTWTRYKPQK